MPHEAAKPHGGNKRQRRDAHHDQSGTQIGRGWHGDADARGQRDVSGHACRTLGQESQCHAREEPAGEFTTTPYPRRGPAHRGTGSRVGAGLGLAAGVCVHVCAVVELQPQDVVDFGWVPASISTSGQ